jgi:hypothetical protein
MPITVRGHNVFADLARDCEGLELALRVGGNRPLRELDCLLLGGAIDHVLESLAKVTNARPTPGCEYEIEPRQGRVEPVVQVRIEVDEDIVAGLLADGVLDALAPRQAATAVRALESLNGQIFEAVNIGVGRHDSSTWTPVGLVDLIAGAIERAMTGGR